ncbi:MAG: ABC transporter ATP-binding protein [Sediminimonas sp.]|uniref:ABC transporter ATP-binding protein n=1 Tax=Sediminimonas sp. TaxID=2823379 RepID=UPI00287050AA|nr:ABC transporter ATP-binding protein [Sediminimonas sp.]MDR9484233.1 ABC transporter ATP-binding protein [Sediminimonas sp.]
MTQSLEINELTKTYGAVHALDKVSLSVAPGERVALLGHNGAGKSTLMKIILGLIPHDTGTVTVTGTTPGSVAARGATAYLPENVAFHPALTGLEQIRHYLRLRGERTDHAMDLLARVGLADAAKRRIGTYSKGMRQRVGLAQALIGKPRLLVLDEPTSGLDPVSRRDFYALLDGLAAEGAAILLSSHALTEVEARTDRLVILSAGVVVTQGALSDLRRQADLPVTVHVTARSGGKERLAEALPQGRMNGTGVNLRCAQSDKMETLARVSELGPLVTDIDVQPPSLEDIYSHFSRRDGQ